MPLTTLLSEPTWTSALVHWCASIYVLTDTLHLCTNALRCDYSCFCYLNFTSWHWASTRLNWLPILCNHLIFGGRGRLYNWSWARHYDFCRCRVRRRYRCFLWFYLWWTRLSYLVRLNPVLISDWRHYISCTLFIMSIYMCLYQLFLTMINVISRKYTNWILSIESSMTWIKSWLSFLGTISEWIHIFYFFINLLF